MGAILAQNAPETNWLPDAVQTMVREFTEFPRRFSGLNERNGKDG